VRGLKEYLCKELTRQGLNVLCATQKPEDLQRIRANLRDGYVQASMLDAKYMGRHGEWTDIPLLANSQAPTSGATLLTMSLDEDFQLEVARAITSIGKSHSVSDLFLLRCQRLFCKKDN